MQIESESTRYIPNAYEDYLPQKKDFNLLYHNLADCLVRSLNDFYKKVKPSEPISICSVKSKSTYSYAIFDGFFFLNNSIQ